MTPLNDLTPFGLFLLGEEPVSIFKLGAWFWNRVTYSEPFSMQTIEDFILLIGTIVAFIAFVLWCCFPIHPKVSIITVKCNFKVSHGNLCEILYCYQYLRYFNSQENLAHQFSLHAAAKSTGPNTSDDRIGSASSKYGQRSSDTSNNLYHCCNSNNWTLNNYLLTLIDFKDPKSPFHHIVLLHAFYWALCFHLFHFWISPNCVYTILVIQSKLLFIFCVLYLYWWWW